MLPAVESLGIFDEYRGHFNENEMICRNTLQKLVDVVALHRQAQFLGRMYDVFITLGVAAWHLGQSQTFLEVLIEALAYVVETHMLFTMMRCMSFAALCQLDQNNPVKAIELYALARQQPHIANSPCYEDIAGKFIAQAAEALPPDVGTEARERGQARDLWETGAELLAELTAEVLEDEQVRDPEIYTPKRDSRVQDHH